MGGKKKNTPLFPEKEKRERNTNRLNIHPAHGFHIPTLWSTQANPPLLTAEIERQLTCCQMDVELG